MLKRLNKKSYLSRFPHWVWHMIHYFTMKKMCKIIIIK